MYREEFLEALDSLLGGSDNYVLKHKANGTLVIHTNLIETEDDRIIGKDEEVDNDEDEDDTSESSLGIY